MDRLIRVVVPAAALCCGLLASSPAKGPAPYQNGNSGKRIIRSLARRRQTATNRGDKADA